MCPDHLDPLVGGLFFNRQPPSYLEPRYESLLHTLPTTLPTTYLPTYLALPYYIQQHIPHLHIFTSSPSSHLAFSGSQKKRGGALEVFVHVLNCRFPFGPSPIYHLPSTIVQSFNFLGSIITVSPSLIDCVPANSHDITLCSYSYLATTSLPPPLPPSLYATLS